MKNVVSSLSYLANFARTQKQLLSISAAAALPRHPKADRAAPGVLYTYIDTHARSGVGIAVHTRLQTPFRALNSRSLMLRMYALWGVWFPPGLYTTTSVRVPVGGPSRRPGSVYPRTAENRLLVISLHR